MVITAFCATVTSFSSFPSKRKYSFAMCSRGKTVDFKGSSRTLSGFQGQCLQQSAAWRAQYETASHRILPLKRLCTAEPAFVPRQVRHPDQDAGDVVVSTVFFGGLDQRSVGSIQG